MSKIKTVTTALTAAALVSGLGLAFAESIDPPNDPSTPISDPMEPAADPNAKPAQPSYTPPAAQPADSSAKPADDRALMPDAPAAGAPAVKADRN